MRGDKEKGDGRGKERVGGESKEGLGRVKVGVCGWLVWVGEDYAEEESVQLT